MFNRSTTYTTERSPTFVGLGDLDGDGALDIVIPNYQADSLSIFNGR